MVTQLFYIVNFKLPSINPAYSSSKMLHIILAVKFGRLVGLLFRIL